MASAQIRHFYNTPTTISSTTTTRQPLQQQQQQQQEPQQHTNNCNSKRRQFQSDTFLCHTQTQSESEATAATLCQSALAAAATPGEAATGATSATGAAATATDDVPTSESWTTDEISASNRNTQHRMRYPLAGSAATCDVAVAVQPAAAPQQHQQCLANPAASLATSTGTSEQDRLATSTCLSRLSSKVSQDSTKPQRKPLQPGSSTSTTPAVGILTDVQKFARSIFPLVIIFNLLPLFYAGK